MRNTIWGSIFEILFLCIFVFLSIPLWENIIDKMDKVKIEIANNNLELVAMKSEDENIRAVTNGLYNVINNSDYNVTGNLLYKFDKSSTLDPNYLNLVIDEKAYDLKYFYYGEDDNNIVYLINTFNLNGKEKKLFNIKLVIKDEMYLKTLGKRYKYTISVENASSLV